MHVPAVSVCIPVYNGEHYLAETLASVFAQTLRNVEIVVLDNASTDGTAQLLDSVSDPRLRWARNEMTVPMHENMNRAVALGHAPLVKLLCADDLLRPRCLELQVGVMTADPELAVVACRQHMVDEHSRILVTGRALRGLEGRRRSSEVIRRIVRSGANPIGGPASVLFRRDAYERSGGMDGRMSFTGDLDLYARLLEHGDFFGMPETLAAFRVASGTLSSRAGRSAYREQLATTRELSTGTAWAVPRREAAIGRAAAPLAWLRRQALFVLSRVTSRGRAVSRGRRSLRGGGGRRC